MKLQVLRIAALTMMSNGEGNGTSKKSGEAEDTGSRRPFTIEFDEPV